MNLTFLKMAKWIFKRNDVKFGKIIKAGSNIEKKYCWYSWIEYRNKGVKLKEMQDLNITESLKMNSLMEEWNGYLKKWILTY